MGEGGWVMGHWKRGGGGWDKGDEGWDEGGWMGVGKEGMEDGRSGDRGWERGVMGEGGGVGCCRDLNTPNGRSACVLDESRCRHG